LSFREFTNKEKIFFYVFKKNFHTISEIIDKTVILKAKGSEKILP